MEVSKMYAERLDAAIMGAVERNIAFGRISMTNEDTGEVSNIAQGLARSLVTEILRRDADETLHMVRQALAQAQADLRWVHNEIPGSDFKSTLLLCDAAHALIQQRIDDYEQKQTREQSIGV